MSRTHAAGRAESLVGVDLAEVRAYSFRTRATQFDVLSRGRASCNGSMANSSPSYHSVSGYGGCQVLVEAIRRAGSLDGDQLRAAILSMNLNTVYGGFKVGREGVQIAHTMLMFQWQDGKKVIVWPDELAPGKPRFPTPPWSQRP